MGIYIFCKGVMFDMLKSEKLKNGYLRIYSDKGCYVYDTRSRIEHSEVIIKDGTAAKYFLESTNKI